jgi:hypothetical protein
VHADEVAAEVHHPQRGEGRLLGWARPTEGAVDGGVHPLLERPGALLLALPDVDVAQPALGSLHAQVDQQPVHRLVAQGVDDAGVGGGVDRDVLDVGVDHGGLPESVRMVFGRIGVRFSA